MQSDVIRIQFRPSRKPDLYLILKKEKSDPDHTVNKDPEMITATKVCFFFLSIYS